MPEEEMSRGNVLHTSGNPQCIIERSNNGLFRFLD